MDFDEADTMLSKMAVERFVVLQHFRPIRRCAFRSKMSLQRSPRLRIDQMHLPQGRGTLLDITVIIVLAAFQYGIFTGSFGWPEDVSLALAVISTYTLRWHIVILDRAQSRRVSP